MAGTVIVVPCYNEERRLDRAELVRLASGRDRVLLVDDGSTDHTRAVFDEIVAAARNADSFALDRNRGKSEAVRQGLIRAIEGGADVVGFVDADLSTPVDEVLRLLEIVRARAEVEVVMAARIALLGRSIERDLRRHYSGRVFATVASVVLRVGVYDTQCGAKFFRVSDALRHALSEPFLSRWSFDVELLGRLLIGATGVRGIPLRSILEVPLERWTDVAGSKLSVPVMIRSGLELFRIERDFARRRAAVTR